jgi:hypothetical protein
LAWTYQRENVISKEQGKRVSQNILRQAKAEKGLIMQINANNLYQRKLL